MDWTTISTLLSVLFGGSVVGGVMTFSLRKANKRKAEAEAKMAEAEAEAKAKMIEVEVKTKEFSMLKDQIEEQFVMLKFERERNKDLMQINIGKEDRIQEKDRLFGEQTMRLRETQDREYQLRLQYNALQLQYKDDKCHKHGCPYREPENALSKKAKQMLGAVDTDYKAIPPNVESTIVEFEVEETEETEEDDTITA